MKSFMFLMALVSSVWAERYSVFVTGIGADKYMADGFVVRTIMCTATGNNLHAVLDYEPARPYGNKLLFDGGKMCEVMKVSQER